MFRSEAAVFFTITIWIVDMAHVFGVIAGIAGNHSLGSPVNGVFEEFPCRHGGVALGDDRVQYSNEEADVIAHRLNTFHPARRKEMLVHQNSHVPRIRAHENRKKHVPYDLIASDHFGIRVGPIINHLAGLKESLLIE